MLELLVLFGGFIFGAGVFSGSDEDEKILGSDGSDQIDGNGGDDRIRSLDGNDILRGGDGDDVLIGNRGNDALNGDDGDDQLFGGRGFDTVVGGEGDDYLQGFFGGDLLDGGQGHDILDGGKWNDKLIGGHGYDVLIGGDGDDILRDVGVGNYGGIGHEALQARKELLGDILGPDERLNELFDTSVPFEDRPYNTQLFFGGDGDDKIASYNSGHRGLAWGDDGDDLFEGINYARGGAGDDVINVDSRFDANVNGNTGDDTISVNAPGFFEDGGVKGGDGNDRIVANVLGDGGGRVSGGNGDDLLDVSGHPEAVVAANGGTGNDFIHLGADTFAAGGTGSDTFFVEARSLTQVSTIADFNPDEDVIMLDASGIAAANVGVDATDIIPENLVIEDVVDPRGDTNSVVSLRLPDSEETLQLVVLRGVSGEDVDLNAIISVTTLTNTELSFAGSTVGGDVDDWSNTTGWTLSSALHIGA